MSLLASTLVIKHRILQWLWKILLDIITKEFADLWYNWFLHCLEHWLCMLWSTLQSPSLIIEFLYKEFPVTMYKSNILIGTKYLWGFKVPEELFLLLNRRKYKKWDYMPIYWQCSVFLQLQNIVAPWFLQNYKLTFFVRLYMCLLDTLERVNSTNHSSWLK